jgi:hypothetical protein
MASVVNDKLIEDITEYIREHRFKATNDETFWDLLVTKFPEVEDQLSFQIRAKIDDELYGNERRTLNRGAYGFPSDGSSVFLFGEILATAINCGFFTFSFSEDSKTSSIESLSFVYSCLFDD